MTTRSVLDQDLVAIRDDILRQGSLVNRAVELALTAFRDQDLDLAQQVIDGDDEIDSLHHKLENNITTTVALQQPMASDLRKLIAALLITNELERMGDYAEGIARTILHYAEGAVIEVPTQLLEMREKVGRMINDVMDAFVEESPVLAKATAKLDDELDALYQQLFELLVSEMGSGELSVEEGTFLSWVGHGLERIGDRVTNICERIIYARTGKVGELNPKHNEDAVP